MLQDSYRPLALVPSTGDEEDDAALTPSHRGYSVDTDALEAGEDSKVPIGGGASSIRILGETSAQQPRARTLGDKDASSRRIQYLPLITQSSMNIVANIAYMKVTQEIVQLRSCATDGPMPCRFLGVLSGSVLFVRCTGQLVAELLYSGDPWPPLVLHHVMSCMLGLSAVMLEARPLLCSPYLHKKTREYAKALSFLWGRGILYLITAAFLLLRYPEVTEMVLAGCFTTLGCMAIVVGGGSQRRLEGLRETLTEDEKVLREKFDQHKDEHGRVKAAKLATVCAELGSRLSHDELEHAVLTLDGSRSGEIEYDTFVDWWRTR